MEGEIDALGERLGDSEGETEGEADGDSDGETEGDTDELLAKKLILNSTHPGFTVTLLLAPVSRSAPFPP